MKKEIKIVNQPTLKISLCETCQEKNDLWCEFKLANKDRSITIVKCPKFKKQEVWSG